MNRPRFWIILLLVGTAGFFLGRASGSMRLGELAATRGDIPFFPVPPHESPPAVLPESGDIVIELPVEGSSSASTFIDVAGRAKIEGGPLVITVKNSVGATIVTKTIAFEGAASEEYGRFSETITFATVPAGNGTIEIARVSGGTPAIRNILFMDAAAADTELGQVKIKVYLHNSVLGPADDCSLVFPVERIIAADAAAYRATIEALLKGPNAAEKSAGYTTAIPVSAAVKSVGVDANGTVIADFTQALDRGVAGSCRVLAIRAQIETTLRQFPETRDVIISVDGNVDETLQP